jgi:hypothetical protein
LAAASVSSVQVTTDHGVMVRIPGSQDFRASILTWHLNFERINSGAGYCLAQKWTEETWSDGRTDRRMWVYVVVCGRHDDDSG